MLAGQLHEFNFILELELSKKKTLQKHANISQNNSTFWTDTYTTVKTKINALKFLASCKFHQTARKAQIHICPQKTTHKKNLTKHFLHIIHHTLKKLDLTSQKII